MNFDKLMNSKINTVADWIIRIVMINILVILCSLPIVTIFPAFVSGYSVFADYIDKKDTKLFSSFFFHFRKNLGRRVLFGVVILVLSYIFLSNAIFYNTLASDTGDWFYTAGYFVTFILIAMLYALLLYTLVVYYELPSVKLKVLFKLALYLAGKYYIITIGLVMINLIPLFMLLTAVTSVLFVFSGVSIPLLIHAIVTKPARQYIKNIGEDPA